MESQNRNLKPTLAITMGDPAGIGPEVVAKALSRKAIRRICNPLVIGDPLIFRQTIQDLGMNLPVREVGAEGAPEEPGKILLLPVAPLSSTGGLRQLPREESARASFAYLERGAQLVFSGKIQGLVTGPVSKEAIHNAGISFRGHTEYLAEISGTKKFVMMLAGERLRVSLVTTHIPHGAVSESLSEEGILNVIAITARALHDFFEIPSPRLGVAALNPHAGEGGLFGTEEEVITRAVQQARQMGVSVSGPWPADTLFYRTVQGEFDAVVCMYHDQALIPLKLLHFDTAVNVTLGLPFIRTSVDHGVAYDLAGRGLASSRSMEEAIRMAARMARTKQGVGGRG